jgi:putative transposase
MRKHKAEEIVAKLRHVEGLAASGRRISECVREIGVTEVTYYRWRNRYGGLESDLAEHLTELEAEITRLRRLVSDLCSASPKGVLARRLGSIDRPNAKYGRGYRWKRHP